MTDRPDLAALGLQAGQAVRFRGPDGERWRPATVAGRERDGSIGLRDAKGASRAIPADRVQVEVTGPRGGRRWVLLTEVSSTAHQPGLF